VYKSAAAALLSLYALGPLSTGLHAQPQRPSEYEVKAPYLLNFLKFVQWPASSTGAENVISICVLGRDPFGDILDRIVSGQQIAGKNVVVRRLTRPADADGCRILFIDSSQNKQLAGTLATLDNTPVLTVSEIPDFVSRGGIIQFVLKEGRVRFEVNLIKAQRNGLLLSSQLLNVASAVRQ
jgi:hypothetical protein